MREVVIGQELVVRPKRLQPGSFVQYERYSTPQVMTLLEALPEPWTASRVARAYGVTEKRAADWLARCRRTYGLVAKQGQSGGHRRVK